MVQGHTSEDPSGAHTKINTLGVCKNLLILLKCRIFVYLEQIAIFSECEKVSIHGFVRCICQVSPVLSPRFIAQISSKILCFSLIYSLIHNVDVVVALRCVLSNQVRVEGHQRKIHDVEVVVKGCEAICVVWVVVVRVRLEDSHREILVHKVPELSPVLRYLNFQGSSPLEWVGQEAEHLALSSNPVKERPVVHRKDHRQVRDQTKHLQDQKDKVVLQVDRVQRPNKSFDLPRVWGLKKVDAR